MTNYLLDSHTFIWSQYTPERLSENCKKILLDKRAVKFLSLVTIWELTIKQSIGKLSLNFDWNQLIDYQSIELVQLSVPQILMMKQLPLIHRDPFDRLLIAQSIVEDLPLITADKEIQKYEFRFVKA